MLGDVYRIPAPRAARGHEQHGQRYAVVVQSDQLQLSTLLVAPTSRGALPTWFRPEIELQGDITRVLLEQTVAVDAQRLTNRVGRLSPAELIAVDDALSVVFGLIRPRSR